jgi:release factor glutamine methyltransferase
MSKVPNTLSEIRRSLIRELSLLFPENEALSIARIILEHVGFPDYSALRNPSEIVNTEIQSEIKKIVRELNKNRPIQYILGETVFMDLKFFVNENVLIPRPETEQLVMNILQDNQLEKPSVIDLGCGSGCIAISLAFHLEECSVTAMDIEEKAIQLAKRNAMANHVNVRFLHQGIFDIQAETPFSHYDIIVSNPPYVTWQERGTMASNVTGQEPEIALFVPDDDPLIFYKGILHFAEKKLTNKGVVWLEINEKYGNETGKLFEDAGYEDVRILKDIHERDRFIRAAKRRTRQAGI